MTISAALATVRRSSSFSRFVPWWTSTLSEGTNFSASRAQLPTTEVGATTSVGPTR